MLRSLITSARGKSALAVAFASPAMAISQPPSRPLPSAQAQADPTGVTVTPERCCVYCGHPLYAPPRAIKLRCPKCFQELPARHVTITDQTDEPRILTSGKILVPAGTHVAAELVACTVDIAGMVLGDVLASHVCTVRGSGKIAGRILCRRLELEPGAQVQGQVELVK